ncbi:MULTISPECIES: hypothetical protein [Mycolicibacterium]|uniref:hypothetical protein n=1 Tax=Mycolicibacterium TaxID=1866885 RepID=UPI0007ED27CD|nr:hypothetical protein [Mycolicibacterium fortuitum]MCA4727029.1 hypothetical protein [Mycolicibacterium fortuitum]OBK07648.1 hypothetical protein A5637_04820 [Mycolicibacterium fortuitum]
MVAEALRVGELNLVLPRRIDALDVAVPRHNFTELPRIRSERPVFERHCPHMVELIPSEAHVGRTHHPELTNDANDLRLNGAARC